MPIRPSLSWARDTSLALLDLLYPPRCLGCGASMPSADEPLCAACVRLLDRPLPHEVTAHIHRLEKAKQAVSTARALWSFDAGGIVQQLQHALKYANRPSHGRALGRLMGQALVAGDPTCDLILPIPLHHTRQLERGYNQSALLADGLSQETGLPVRSDVLLRIRPTRSQTNLSRNERQDNVRGAFAVKQPLTVRGLGVWLIDDVLTTGSTASAAAASLHDAGADEVHVYTLAFARR